MIDKRQYDIDEFEWNPKTKTLWLKEGIVFGQLPSWFYIQGRRLRVKFEHYSAEQLENHTRYKRTIFEPVQPVNKLELDPEITAIIPWKKPPYPGYGP